MENYSKRERRLIGVVRIGLAVALAAAALWGWVYVRDLPEKAVVPFSRWEAWPYPFSLAGELHAPSVTNVCRRGGAEDQFFDRFKRVIIEADEVATEMVYEFHSQAEDGETYDIRTPADKARRRLGEIREEFEKEPCPGVCKPVLKAMARSLREAERFYRVSASDKGGFSVKALKRAWTSYTRLEEEMAGFVIQPPVPDRVMAGIVTNDCVALARAAIDWEQTLQTKKLPVRKSDAQPENPEDMSPGQAIAQAHECDDYLRGLWLVLNGKGYSPYLASAFLRWRSEMQVGFFGMSNWSQIPNRQYNEVRYRALARVMAYLRDHPHDEHAQAQKVALSEAPNIQRGGMFGNTCPMVGRGEGGE